MKTLNISFSIEKIPRL